MATCIYDDPVPYIIPDSVVTVVILPPGVLDTEKICELLFFAMPLPKPVPILAQVKVLPTEYTMADVPAIVFQFPCVVVPKTVMVYWLVTIKLPTL